MNETWTTIVTLITTLGGYSIIQYSLDWYKTRKSTKTKDASEAFNNEFTIYKTQIEFLNSQITTLQCSITERDNKILSLTEKLEELSRSLNNLFNENQEIKKKLCLKYDCTSREVVNK